MHRAGRLMGRPYVPQAILDAAHARSAARADGDWGRADTLLADIEAGGWRVIDSGTDFSLEPMVPPDRIEDGRVMYGHSAAVPSRLDEPSSAVTSLVVLIPDATSVAEGGMVDALRAHRSPGTEVIVVLEDPSSGVMPSLVELTGSDPQFEIVGTATSVGPGALRNIGLRRAVGEIVVFMERTVLIAGDLAAPLSEALQDPGVAVVGVEGFNSTDLRTFVATPPGQEATAIAGPILAFRRVDAHALGPIDEAFRSASLANLWWSLVLREGEPGSPVRRVALLPNLPVVQAKTIPAPDSDVPDARAEKRDRYRILDRFRGRDDLASEPSMRHKDH